MTAIREKAVQNALRSYAAAKEVNDILNGGVTSAFTSTTSIVMTPTTDTILSNGTGLIVGHTSQLTISDSDGATNLIPEVQILGTAKADSSILLASANTTNDSTVAPSVNLLKIGNAALGSSTIVASGEILGEVNFFGDDGVDYESCAVSLKALVDTTPGAGDMPGRFAIYCSADGAETPLEKVRVTGAAATSTVTVGVGGTSTGTLHLAGATSGTVALRATAAAGDVIFILPAAVGTSGQQLATDGATPAVTSWAAAGSLREFKSIMAEVSDQAESALNRLLGTNVYDFRYKNEPDAVTTRDFDTIYRGVLGDELPEVMHHDGKIFNPVSAFGETVLAFKALFSRLTALEAKLQG